MVNYAIASTSLVPSHIHYMEKCLATLVWGQMTSHSRMLEYHLFLHVTFTTIIVTKPQHTHYL